MVRRIATGADVDGEAFRAWRLTAVEPTGDDWMSAIEGV
jgi:hypothetical protein